MSNDVLRRMAELAAHLERNLPELDRQIGVRWHTLRITRCGRDGQPSKLKIGSPGAGAGDDALIQALQDHRDYAAELWSLLCRHARDVARQAPEVGRFARSPADTLKPLPPGLRDELTYIATEVDLLAGGGGDGGPKHEARKPRIITRESAEKKYGRSRTTLYRLIKQGKLTDHREKPHPENAMLMLDDHELADRFGPPGQ